MERSPLSKIEFLGDTRTITKIILELNVTKNGQVDKVKEVYIQDKKLL